MFYALLLESQVMLHSWKEGRLGRSTAGHFHRIDFGGVPVEWSAGVRSATTHPKIALVPHGEVDHILAGVAVVVAIRSALRIPVYKERIEAALNDAPPIPHHMDPEEHLSLLEKIPADHLGRDLSEDRSGPKRDGYHHRVGTS